MFANPPKVRPQTSNLRPHSIVTVARLVPWKGIGTLIAALPLVREKVPDAMLTMAAIQSDRGEAGKARQTLEDLVAKYPSSEAAGKARARLAGAKR